MTNKNIYNFKSSKEFFYDEKNGLKNNTVRKIDMSDKRFQDLLNDWKEKDYGFIRISHAEFGINNLKTKSIDKDGMNNFMREVKHIAVYQDLMIITWKENN